jgi:hypothetical protein
MKIPLPKNFKPKQPPLIQDFQEIAIAFFSPQIQPNFITVDNLQEKQVIPADWQLVQPSQPQSRIQQLIFKQGLKIMIIAGKIRFVSQIKQNQVKFEQIITNFIYGFPQIIIYRSQINLRRLISLPGNPNNASKFIKETILNQGEWQNFPTSKMKAEVSFLYNLPKTALIVSITDLMIRSGENKLKSALLFKGTYNYSFNHHSKIVNLRRLESVIKTLPDSITTFNYIINQVFLGNG